MWVYQFLEASLIFFCLYTYWALSAFLVFFCLDAFGMQEVSLFLYFFFHSRVLHPPSSQKSHQGPEISHFEVSHNDLSYQSIPGRCHPLQPIITLTLALYSHFATMTVKIPQQHNQGQLRHTIPSTNHNLSGRCPPAVTMKCLANHKQASLPLQTEFTALRVCEGRP